MYILNKLTVQKANNNQCLQLHCLHRNDLAVGVGGGGGREGGAFVVTALSTNILTIKPADNHDVESRGV